MKEFDYKLDYKQIDFKKPVEVKKTKVDKVNEKAS